MTLRRLLTIFATLFLIAASLFAVHHRYGVKRHAKYYFDKARFSLLTITGAIPKSEPWQNRLYTPTQITKIGDLYFIVDCWHNRVLYNRTLEKDISQWSVLDDDLAGPHSIASDSYFYVVEDTGRNSLRAYRKVDSKFTLVQTVKNLGERTHRVRFDPDTSAFYVVSSNSQDITKLRRIGDMLRVEYRKHLDFLRNRYTRSFTILDGDMFFVSGPKAIIKARYKDDSFAIIREYKVPDNLREMNDLFRTENYYYLTATPMAIIRTKSLEAMENGDFEEIYERLGLKGTPYYFGFFDNRLYLPQITEYSGIISFVERRERLDDIDVLFDFGPPVAMDLIEEERLPK